MTGQILYHFLTEQVIFLLFTVRQKHLLFTARNVFFPDLLNSVYIKLLYSIFLTATELHIIVLFQQIDV